MHIINMKSSADKVKGQGVGSAYLEMVSLVSELKDYKININNHDTSSITHYHTIDLTHYFHTFKKNIGVRLGYVHFLPETIDGSLKMPKPIRTMFDKYMISFYKRMDYLVTVNPYFEDKLTAYGIDPEKIVSIPNYVSNDDFYPMSKYELSNIRKKYCLDNKFTVLCVGQVQTRKGVKEFIEVAKDNPDKQFVWAGGFSFGAITHGYQTLKKIVEDPPANVKFLGIVDRSEMNSIYNIASVLFMPSYNELFPMAILEAMSVGLPIVLRDLDIYKGILEGYYIPGVNDTFSTIIDQLAYDELFYESAKDMSSKGNAYYSRENILAMWKALYDRLSAINTGEKKAKRTVGELFG